MLRRKFLAYTAAFIASVAAIHYPGEVAHAETQITMNVWFPRVTAFYNEYMMGWAKAVEEKSGGNIKVNVPAQSMAPPPGQLQLLLDGGADVVMIINAFHGDKFMLPMIGALPFTAESEEGAQVALWRTYKQYFEVADEYKGIKVLGLTMPASNTIQSMGDPIRSIADLQGKKVRTDPGPMGAFFEKAGATIVVRPANESFEMMSGGVIDVNLMTSEGAVTLGYSKFLKNVTEFPGGLGRFVFTFAMSKEKWDSLTAEEQKIVEDAAGEALSRSYGKLLDQMQKDALKTFEEQGVKREVASPEATTEFKQALEFISQNWLEGANSKGVDGKAALDFYMKTAANPN